MGFRLETRSIAASAIFLITALQALDITVVNVAIPRLEAAMATSASISAWIVTAYILGTAILAPLTGWLRRRLGCRLLFQLAIGAFGLASLACAVADTAPVMIGARLLQGTAAGVLQPLSLAVLMDLYPARQHGKVTANWMAVLMVGPAIGPLLGGTMTDLAGWPMIFLINAPISLIALVALSVSLPAEEVEDRRASDLVGLVLMTVAIGTLQVLLQQSQGPEGTAGAEVVEGVVATTALVAFLVHTLRAPAPIVHIRALCDRNFLAAVLIMFVTCACLMGTIMLIPRLGEKSLGYSASAAGFLIVPRGVTTMVISLWLARIIDRLDGRWIVAAGVITVATGMAMLALLPDGNPSPWLIAAATVQGAGTGMIFAPLTPLAFATMQPRQRTDAMGLLSLSRILGSSMGGAAAIRLFVFELSGSAAAVAGTPSALGAYRADFLALCLATTLSLLAVPLFRPLRRVPTPATESAD